MLFDNPSLQLQYLTDLIKHQKPVNLFLKNGRKLSGLVTGITNEAIFFQHAITDIIYKRMIKTILPVVIKEAV